MNDIKERIDACLTESTPEACAGNILHEFRLSQLPYVLAFFIERYENECNLLAEFWNSKSDACPLEDERQDEQIIQFRRFVKERNTNLTGNG